MITIGNYHTAVELTCALVDGGFFIGSWARDVLGSSEFTIATDMQKVCLARVTPRDLGFLNGAHRKGIYKCAQQQALDLCPPEVGPQLRLQYNEQPPLESIQVGMTDCVDSRGHRSQFRVVHGADGFKWLAGDHRHPEDFWAEDEQFVFMKMGKMIE